MRVDIMLGGGAIPNSCEGREGGHGMGFKECEV